MYKIDQDSDVLFGNLQVQPRKFEPLESGNDSVHLNLSESDSSSKKDGITISTTRWKNRSHGLVSLSEYVENCCSKIINKLMYKVHISSLCLALFCKRCLQLSFCQYESPFLLFYLAYSAFFRRYNAMGCRVFTGQKMFREKFIKVRDRNFILCQGIGIWKENQKLKHC